MSAGRRRKGGFTLMTRRILSMVLALSMMLTVFPAPALAAAGGEPLPDTVSPQTLDEQNSTTSVSVGNGLEIDADGWPVGSEGGTAAVVDYDWNYAPGTNTVIFNTTTSLNLDFQGAAVKFGLDLSAASGTDNKISNGRFEGAVSGAGSSTTFENCTFGAAVSGQDAAFSKCVFADVTGSDIPSDAKDLEAFSLMADITINDVIHGGEGVKVYAQKNAQITAAYTGSDPTATILANLVNMSNGIPGAIFSEDHRTVQFTVASAYFFNYASYICLSFTSPRIGGVGSCSDLVIASDGTVDLTGFPHFSDLSSPPERESELYYGYGWRYITRIEQSQTIGKLMLGDDTFDFAGKPAIACDEVGFYYYNRYTSSPAKNAVFRSKVNDPRTENCSFEGTVSFYNPASIKNCTFNCMFEIWNNSTITFENCVFSSSTNNRPDDVQSFSLPKGLTLNGVIKGGDGVTVYVQKGAHIELTCNEDAPANPKIHINYTSGLLYDSISNNGRTASFDITSDDSGFKAVPSLFLSIAGQSENGIGPGGDLVIGADGLPDLSNISGSSVVINSPRYYGDGWYYETRTPTPYLSLLSGSYDFSGLPALNCNVEVGSAVSVKNGTFNKSAWFTGNSSSSEFSAENCIFEGTTAFWVTPSFKDCTFNCTIDTTIQYTSGASFEACVFSDTAFASGKVPADTEFFPLPGDITVNGSIKGGDTGSDASAKLLANLAVTSNSLQTPTGVTFSEGHRKAELTLPTNPGSDFYAVRSLVLSVSTAQEGGIGDNKDLVIGLSGLPDLSTMSASADMGGFTRYFGDGWFYDAYDEPAENCTLRLFSGSYDFAGLNPLNCRLSILEDVQVTDGTFNETVSVSIAASGTTFRRCVFLKEPVGIAIPKVSTSQCDITSVNGDWYATPLKTLYTTGDIDLTTARPVRQISGAGASADVVDQLFQTQFHLNTLTADVELSAAKLKLQESGFTFQLNGHDLAAGMDYTGQPAAVTFEYDDGTGARLDTSAVTIWYATEPSASEFSDDVPVEAGTYYIYAISVDDLTDSDDYDYRFQYLFPSEGDQWSFEIRPADPTLSLFDVTVPQNAVYDGKPHSATAAAADSSVTGEVTVGYYKVDDSGSIVSGSYTEDAPVNAGTYQAAVSTTGGSYTAADKLTSTNWRFTIARIPVAAEDFEITVNGKALDPDNILHFDADDAPAASAVCATGEVTGIRYVEVNASPDTATATPPTKAGTYQIIVDLVPDENHYLTNLLQFSDPAWRFVIDEKAAPEPKPDPEPDPDIPEPEPDPEPEAPDAATVAGGGIMLAATTAVVGGSAYLIGTQVYLTSVLPEGAAIPTSRLQLAQLLWTAAGSPEPQTSALFTDISAEAVTSQKAARWCVEQGLLKDYGEAFRPGDYTFRVQVIKAWNDLQAMQGTK